MIEITILHISDLHFGITDDGTFYPEDRERVVASFISSYKNELNDEKYRPDAIVISGDIGWKGAKEDYDEFIDTNGFLNQLMEITEVDRDKIFVCPGNHDKNIPSKYKKLNFRKDRTWRYIENNCEEFAVLFQNYSAAMETCGLFPYSTCFAKSFLYGYRSVNIKGKNLCFIAQNTAWLCDYREDKTKKKDAIEDEKYLSMAPAFVEQTVRTVSILEPHVDAVITLFHHPKEWLKETETIRVNGPQLAFERLLEKTDIVCRGHEHQNYSTLYGDTKVHAAGAISSNDTIESSCNIIKLIFDDRTPKKTTKHCTFEARWNPDGKEVQWTPSELSREKIINSDEIVIFLQEELSKFKTREQERETTIKEQESTISEKDKTITWYELKDRTEAFIYDVDKCLSEEMPPEEKVQAIEDLKNTYSEDIISLAEKNLGILLECFEKLDILHMRINCTDQARQICAKVFDEVRKLLSKHNEENTSRRHILSLASDNKPEGSGK